MTHRYITPAVFTLVDIEVYDGVPIAKRVREVMDYDILQVVQDGNQFWFERLSSKRIPKFVANYLIKLIEKRLGLEHVSCDLSLED